MYKAELYAELHDMATRYERFAFISADLGWTRYARIAKEWAAYFYAEAERVLAFSKADVRQYLKDWNYDMAADMVTDLESAEQEAADEIDRRKFSVVYQIAEIRESLVA